jgi:hypothetical protein
MGEQLYGLTARTADQLRGVLADGGRTGGRQTSGSEGAGVTWVVVTGEADADGWHPGAVHVTSGPGWAEGTMAVLVAAGDVDGAELVEGCRYLCTRTGSAADGTARFRASGARVDYTIYQSTGADGTLTPGGGTGGTSPVLATVDAGVWFVMVNLRVSLAEGSGGSGGVAGVNVSLRHRPAGTGSFGTGFSDNAVKHRITANSESLWGLTLGGIVSVTAPVEFFYSVTASSANTVTAGLWGTTPRPFVVFRLAGAPPATPAGLSGTFGDE